MTPARSDFDPMRFFHDSGAGPAVVVSPKRSIFVQGEPADSIYYLNRGRLKLVIVSPQGKQAVVTILMPGCFVGENALTGTHPRSCSAITLTTCEVVRIGRVELTAMLDQYPIFASHFLTCLLQKAHRMEEDRADHLFHSSERRLVRALLQLSEPPTPGTTKAIVGKLSQETLAELIGTTRSRVSFFMNRFRERGMIRYARAIEIDVARLEEFLQA